MYKRITAYIYSYENGEKICNCGYGRFDICDNQCKVYINIKVPDRYTMGIAEIYLLAEDEPGGKIRKEILGRTGGLNGSICYRQICDRKHMAGDIGMDNIKGVLIYNGESLSKAFYCGLNGEEPDILSLEEEKDNINIAEFEEEDKTEGYGDIFFDDVNCKENNSRDNISRENISNENISKENINEENVSEGNYGGNIAVSNAANDNAVDDYAEEQYTASRELRYNETDRQGFEENNDDQAVNMPDMANEEIQNEKNNENNQEQKDKWQELLFSKFPKVRINFGGESSEAIKMRPHDLVWFPRKYWRFSNNRCLLNGYYTYRYIMLVKGMGDREGNYYLAVPGKNMVNEAISARKQGFSEFVTSKGDLGFWCCKVGQ